MQGYKSNQVGFDIFVLKTNTGIEYREFQNVDVMQGSTDALLNLVKLNGYRNIFVHFLNKEMWETIQIFRQVLTYLFGLMEPKYNHMSEGNSITTHQVNIKCKKNKQRKNEILEKCFQ